MDLKRTIKKISERLQIQGKNKGNTVEGMVCTKQIVAKLYPEEMEVDLNYGELHKNKNFEVKTTF